jgi:SpoVK/Ycf46/Vps4 family AAA+-type ATPase
MKLEENEDEEHKNEIKTADAYYRAANRFYEKGAFKKAIPLYNKAIKHARQDDPVYKYFYNRGLAFACLEEYQKAQDDILNVVALKPDYVEAWCILGLAREYLNDFEGAIEMYTKALQVNPDFRDAQNRKELVEAKKRNNKTNLVSKERSSKTGSCEYTAILEKAKNMEKEDKSEEALELIEEKLKKDPDDFQLLISKRFLRAKIDAASRPDIICGLDEAKEEIDTYVIAPLTSDNPLYTAEIVQSSKGVLLHGPPGGGKNHLTINLAKGAGIEIIEIALHEVLNMWSGESEKRLKMLFDTATENAKKGKPTIIFVNEMDALGLARSMTAESESSWSRDLRNTLRILLDEVQKIPNIIVVGATNYIWSVDDALKRPGRFGGVIMYVGPPDEKERETLFKHCARETPGHENLDFKKLAETTRWFTPDDIREVCKKVHLKLAKKNDEKIVAETKDYDTIIQKRFPVALTWLRKVAAAWLEGKIEDHIDERLLDDICQVDPIAKAKREALERDRDNAKEEAKGTKREPDKVKHQKFEYID